MTTATKITLFRVVMIPVFLVCMYLSAVSYTHLTLPTMCQV